MRRYIRDRLDPKILRIVEDFQSVPGTKIGLLVKKIGLEMVLEDTEYEQDGFLDLRPEYGTESGFVIVVNKNISVERQRWTVAHEIGHFLLHDIENMREPKYRSSDVLYFPDEANEEKEANAFAADLLIPMTSLDKAIKGRYQTKELHRLFWVSEQAMRYRLESYNRWKIRARGT